MTNKQVVTIIFVWCIFTTACAFLLAIAYFSVFLTGGYELQKKQNELALVKANNELKRAQGMCNYRPEKPQIFSTGSVSEAH